MFPGIDTHERYVVAGYGVLVGSGDDLESTGRLVLDEPGPATALDAGQGSIDLTLQSLKGAEIAIDGRLAVVQAC